VDIKEEYEKGIKIVIRREYKGFEEMTSDKQLKIMKYKKK
jgi:hypothetical protein